MNKLLIMIFLIMVGVQTYSQTRRTAAMNSAPKTEIKKETSKTIIIRITINYGKSLSNFKSFYSLGNDGFRFNY